jgi:hypothetical protein
LPDGWRAYSFFRLVPVLQKLTGIKKGEVVESEESRGDYLLLIREILKHVVKHPDAKDTADGIHKFWLSSKTVHQSSDKVREVLDIGREKGWLTKRSAAY